MKTAWYAGMALALAAACSWAQPGEGGEAREHAGRRIARPGGEPEGAPLETFVQHVLENEALAAEIGLSEEQRTLLRDELYKLRVKMVDLRAELEKAGMEQARLLTQPEVDEKALMAVVDKTGGLRTEMARLGIRRLLLVKKTLKPEQIEKAREVMHRRWQARMAGEREPDRPRSDRMERRRPWPGRPPGPEAERPEGPRPPGGGE